MGPASGQASAIGKVGEYIRLQSTIPRRLNEMAALITDRVWGAQYEFWAHSRLALTAAGALALES
jgi:4-carboxymuconolactone decarboxylase